MARITGLDSTEGYCWVYQRTHHSLGCSSYVEEDQQAQAAQEEQGQPRQAAQRRAGLVLTRAAPGRPPPRRHSLTLRPAPCHLAVVEHAHQRAGHVRDDPVDPEVDKALHRLGVVHRPHVDGHAKAVGRLDEGLVEARARAREGVVPPKFILQSTIDGIDRFLNSEPPQNVLAAVDVRSLAALADFDAVKSERRLLSPLRLFGLGRLINRFLAPFPIFNSLCLRHYTVCRSLRRLGEAPRTATVVIPARNECGNIESAVKRIPPFAESLEIIFVEGHSHDGTWSEIERVVVTNPQLTIKALRQRGKGKADAVYTGFDAASGEVLIILDADLTMPPEQLPKFWEVIQSQKGEFINGSRLIYPMEHEAMRFLNLVANKIFSLLFTWLLGQRFTDTLCGTKVLRRSDYERLKTTRSYFGDFDPFGDFDLIFGASKLGLKIVEVPIRYANRTYGETQISRFRHGLLLLRMLWFAFLRIKAP